LDVATRTGVEKVILNDGSLVWLRGESKLVYYEKPDEGIRYSELQGEALFEVAKDAARPFIIQCGEVRLKVLGTSFSVKTGINELELKVLTGKVNLSSEVNKVTVDVEPNEQVTYRSNGEIEKLSLAKEAVAAITENTGYNMQFSNISMAEVFKGIEGKFDVKVNLVNPRIGNCHITADFTDHSLESTLQMITEVLDVNYSREGDLITVNGNGCK
jgi:ferric-dicitrate binding protein FerR (iron transport regulator)